MTVRLPILILFSCSAMSVTADGQVSRHETTGIAPDRFMGGIAKAETVQAPAARSDSATLTKTHKAAKTIKDICRGC
jgi:hypothetical protein